MLMMGDVVDLIRVVTGPIMATIQQVGADDVCSTAADV